MSKWIRESWQVIILVLVSLCWLAPSASGQVRGTFTGLVSDPTGAVIPNATVTATNEGTGVATPRPTNSEGFYTIPDLQPGFYTLRAEAQGFKTFVNAHIELSVGYTQRVNFKLEVGAVTQSVTVEGQAPMVDTETDRLSELVTARQVANLPLNGRNVFQMIQLAPGAVSTTGVITEPGNRGFTTVVNGARVNMNGYYIDGVSDKGLSGGSNTQPSLDTVQEFRVDTEVISAEYGSSVGSITTIVSKTGTNDIHGDLYEYVRNDKLDAENYFENPKNPFRMNQFGGTIGGPIKKNKLFFFGSFEGERTRVAQPELELMETPAFRNLIIQNAPNSVGALLFKNFPGPTPTGSPAGPGIGTPDTLATYLTSDAGTCKAFDATCLGNYNIDPASPFGTALLASGSMPTFGAVSASAEQHSKDQFYDGNQFSGRIDWQGEHNKVFGRYFFDRYNDPLYSPATNGGAPAAFVSLRGFASPQKFDYPQLALGWSHTFSPNMLNEFHAGWNRNVTDVGQTDAGVPNIYTDTGEVQYGGYNGYPQIFHEEVFHFSDIATYTHGKHTFKFGGEISRNYENSEFNVGRPSYEFTDSLALTQAIVESVAGGVVPGTIDPTTGDSTGGAHLSSNVRAWRNISTGLFVNDDIKVSHNFTLTLGLRYDLYTRHTEKYGQTTQLVLPAGSNLTARVRAINCYVDVSGAKGYDGNPCNGGFEAISGALTTGDHNNFGPRLGFAWDVFGDGKTSLRGGFGVSYNGEVYNPLSNSRWDPPFYSFNLAFCGTGNNVGPAFTDSCIFGPQNGAAPTFTGNPSNIGSGPAGATDNAFAGNLSGWNPYNANAAFLTGVVFPGFRDPYVFGTHLGVERQLPGNSVLKVSWVGTFGHKLYRSEDINRVFGGRVTEGGSGPSSGGECSLFGPYRVNCLYGRLRTWENSVNSNYDGLQVVYDKRMSHGLEWHANYVYSHSLDGRSTWHSGATTASGAAEGFSMDQALPGLDYGNSTFDIHHAFTNSFVWQLPWYQSQKGFTGHLLGGWGLNNIITWHSGFPWEPYCSNSSFPSGTCDFNQDGVSNDRPNQLSSGFRASNARSAFEGGAGHLTASMFLACSVSPDSLAACPSTYKGPYDGNMARNAFRGPTFADIDLSLFKNIKASERVNLQFRAEAFNIANRVNLYLPNMRLGQSAGLFGTSSQAYPAREIQFALKMIF
jgi:hypothetical protein